MAPRKPLKEVLAEFTMPAAPQLVLSEEDGTLRCVACGHRCRIKEGSAGICMFRFNRNGVLRVPAGYVAGLNVDPIEKKPLYHVLPGRDALSFGMLGCNFHCPFCQNWVSSQVLRDDNAVAYPRETDADSLVQAALSRGAPIIVSTYNEPLITADWAAQIFDKAHEKGLKCGFVTNGHASPEVLAFLEGRLEMASVDLKCFTQTGYATLGGVLKNVLDSISRLKEMGVWIEVVTLVVPGFNDSATELRGIADFVVSVSPEVPWHVTAFHPDYTMTDGGPTPLSKLNEAHTIGKEAGLHYVYQGNIAGGDFEHTYCHSCNALLIRRRGFYVLENRMRGGNCPDCGAAAPGIWEDAPPHQST